jgi:hypothetical protein
MTQSYLVAESENTKIQASREQFELLVKLLDGSNSINNFDADDCAFSTCEVLQVNRCA